MAKYEVKYITEKYYRKFDKQKLDLEELAYNIARELAKLEGHKVGKIDSYIKVEFPWIHDEWEVTINEVYVRLSNEWELEPTIDIVFPVAYLWDKNWKEFRKKEIEAREFAKKIAKKENAKINAKHQKKWEQFIKLSEEFDVKDIDKMWKYKHGIDIDE